MLRMLRIQRISQSRFTSLTAYTAYNEYLFSLFRVLCFDLLAATYLLVNLQSSCAFHLKPPFIPAADCFFHDAASRFFGGFLRL